MTRARINAVLVVLASLILWACFSVVMAFAAARVIAWLAVALEMVR